MYLCMFTCVVRNPDTTHNKQHMMNGAGRVLQPAAYNATYTPAAHQQSRKQHHACAVN